MRAVSVLALATVGCSWLFVEAPPPEARWRGEYASCTDSRVAPAVDGVLATAGTAVAAGMLGLMAECTHECGLGLVVLVPALLVAIPTWPSMSHGLRETARCRAAHAAFVPEAAPPPPLAPQLGHEALRVAP